MRAQKQNLAAGPRIYSYATDLQHFIYSFECVYVQQSFIHAGCKARTVAVGVHANDSTAVTDVTADNILQGLTPLFFASAKLENKTPKTNELDSSINRIIRHQHYYNGVDTNTAGLSGIFVGQSDKITLLTIP